LGGETLGGHGAYSKTRDQKNRRKDSHQTAHSSHRNKGTEDTPAKPTRSYGWAWGSILFFLTDGPFQDAPGKPRLQFHFQLQLPRRDRLERDLVEPVEGGPVSRLAG